MENEKQLDVNPFHSQACLLQREINQVQLKFAEEMYNIKQIKARLEEITHDSLKFRKRLSEVLELVQSHLTWIGANASFSDNMPQNTIGGLKMELTLLNFSNKAATRLSTTIDKTIEKCNVLYKKICSTHNKCQASAANQG